MNYWHWFFRGTSGEPGYRKFVNRWLLFHAVVGAALFFLVPISLKDAANTVLLPLTGVFIGLSFAWAGNALTLLQSEEIEHLAEHRVGDLKEYVFTYQSAILAILVTLSVWGIAGLGVIDSPSPIRWAHRLYPAVAVALYGLASLTLRECWHVVLFSQLLLLARREIRRATRPPENSG
ncbi:MAG: hypothetical protein ACKVU1_03055 [bacterium]